MAFNTRKASQVGGRSPIQTGKVADTRTANQAVGFTRDAKSELFLLATTSFFGQDKFYEAKELGVQRFVALVQDVTKADPAWMLNFITWLRGDGNIRSGAVVASMEAARIYGGLKGEARQPIVRGEKDYGRLLAQAGIGRADEVGEALAYWTTKYGKAIPKPIKRGLADALVKLTNEFSVLKYDTDSKGWRLADLINMLHPTPGNLMQADLFAYVVAKAYGEVAIPEGLVKLRARQMLMALPVDKRRKIVTDLYADVILKDAGMTWESLAGWLQGPMDKAAWEAIIPSMGLMAQIRNLRNFDQAGVSDRAIAPILARLMDPEQVKRSRQLPFRFLSAHRNAPSLRWGHALATALDSSLTNIPTMPGRTLVLVDTSGSMDARMSEHGDVARWDIGALFGIALQKRLDNVSLVSYSGTGGGWSASGRVVLKEFLERPGAPVLAECQRWKAEGFNTGGGTPTAEAIAATYMGHDRVILLTDEQADSHHYGNKGVGGAMPDRVPLYTFNLAGYKAGHTAGSPYRHTFGGLTDHAFGLIPTIEASVAGTWPWESQG